MAIITTETRTDTNNLSGWNTIVITYTDGIETSRQTTYDIAYLSDGVTPKPTSGLVITDDRDHVGLTRRLTEDAQNVNKWTAIEVNYDTTSGASIATMKTTSYDDGTSLQETFDATGTAVVSSVRTDAATSTATWDTITTTVDTATGVTTVLTVLDDKSSTQESKTAEGVLVQRVRTDATGVDSTSNYSTITTDYDVAGNVAQVAYVFDAGLTRTETYTTVDGNTYLSGVVQTDAGAQYGWTSVTETLNAAGHTTARTQTNDDGSERVQSFDATGQILTDQTTDANGVVKLDTYDATGLISTAQTDGSTDGLAEKWTTKTVTYENGVVVGDSIAYDNGTSVQKTFVAGTLQSLRFQDGADGTAADTKSYDTVLTNYAADGDRLSSVMTYDNGDTGSRTYNDDGSLGQLVLTDVSGGRNWDTITRDYSATGAMESVTVVRDDGVTTENTFSTTTGNRTSSVTTDATGVDSTADWASIEKTFDLDGNMSQHVRTFDNGSVSTTNYTYTNGELSGVSATQTGSATGTGIYTASMVKTYAEDSGGALYVNQTTHTFSNDKQVVRTFAEDGDQATQIQTDISLDGTGFKWDSISIVNDDAGRKDSQLITYDSGDEIVVLFDDANAKTARVQFDGDNSNTWEFRVTEYDAAGTGTVSYATAATLDNEYRNFFDLELIS
ncbi:hypothetical protein [Loktanella sp. SALINAS62]|uniref:hypothetical protein n=1 Tax=Loktanella sp. SALINAS62 TaxID=2706124 RepID=UPI001B8CC8A7|nr:hypothetical protein [Loktanella sp. SALINAS62]MBS1302874.1 hypothetical protein [Loktanella sp. SALINAS62]